MDTDIRDEIDRSFGEGPPVADSGDLIIRGRAAVRRRRLAEGGSLLLVAATVLVIALVSTGGGPDRTAPGPAATPTTAPSRASPPVVPDAKPDVVTVQNPRLPADMPVSLEPDGTVSIRPGVEIDRTIVNPYHRADPPLSVALEYTWRGTTYWYSGYVDDDRGSGSANQPVLATMTFRSWVQEQRPLRGPGPGAGTTEGDWPGHPDLDLVRLVGDSERLRPAGDVTIIQQRAHPTLPDTFATAADQSAVAEVRFEGERWYVLARRTADGSPADYIAVTAEDGGASLDDFLDLSRERYAEGGGGLL